MIMDILVTLVRNIPHANEHEGYPYIGFLIVVTS